MLCFEVSVTKIVITHIYEFMYIERQKEIKLLLDVDMSYRGPVIKSGFPPDIWRKQYPPALKMLSPLKKKALYIFFLPGRISHHLTVETQSQRELEGIGSRENLRSPLP